MPSRAEEYVRRGPAQVNFGGPGRIFSIEDDGRGNPVLALNGQWGEPLTADQALQLAKHIYDQFSTRWKYSVSMAIHE